MSEPAPTLEEQQAELVRLRKEEAFIASEAREVEKRIRSLKLAEHITRIRNQHYDETIGEDYYWMGFSEADEDGGRQIDFYQWHEHKGYVYVDQNSAVDLVETLQRLYGIN